MALVAEEAIEAAVGVVTDKALTLTLLDMAEAWGPPLMATTHNHLVNILLQIIGLLTTMTTEVGATIHRVSCHPYSVVLHQYARIR